MLCKTLRSEYMKRFKDPHWEVYRNSYEEMLKYRLTRRLLEHAHKPWLWDGWDGSSGSNSGHSTPPSMPGEPVTAVPKEPGPAELPRKLAPAEREVDTGVTTKLRGACNQAAHSEGQRNGSEPLWQAENNKDGEKNTESSEKSASHLGPQHSHSALSKVAAQKIDTSPQKISLTKEIQHPFALYASGERKKDIGSQKTHNVCATASENEIHESALRAKNRRQKEKRKQLQHKQRARSADAERVLRRKPSPADNPWMTEYMRCYSARGR